MRPSCSTPVVLSERPSRDGRVRWQARISEDRGRLEVVGIVAPSDQPTVIAALTEAELRALLAGALEPRGDAWICAECGTTNDRSRRWCRVCSSHDTPTGEQR